MTTNPPLTYVRSGPLLPYWPLLTWIEENLGRRVNSDPDLACLLPVTYRTIHRWRTGGIRLATALRIAHWFATRPTDIWPNWDTLTQNINLDTVKQP